MTFFGVLQILVGLQVIRMLLSLAPGKLKLFEGVPTFPDAGRFWQMIDKHSVSIFYTAPTAIRALIKASS